MLLRRYFDSNSSSGSSPTRSPALSPKSILSQDKDVESKLPMLDGGSVNRMNSGYSNSSNTGNGEGEDDVSDVGSEDFRIPVTVVPFDASSSSSTSKYEDGTNEQDSTNRSRTSGTSGSSLDGSSTPPSITRTDSTMGPREAPLTAAMDIFSLGCVLAELFTEGDNSIFDLSNLLLYRQNDPTALTHVNNYLNTIENVYVKDMIYSMISLNPNERLTADEYLKRCTAKLTTNNQFTNANSENKISGKKISENKKCENKTSTTTTNDTDTGTVATEKITSAINDNGEEEEMHGKENVMYEGSVPVFPNHFHTWLFPFLKRLQCDPAFATADMKVLAITKHFSDIVTIVGGASRDQNNGNSENIFSTKLENCTTNQKMKSKNINYNKESKGNNEKIEEMKVNKNEEKEELSQLDLLMASLHTTMKSLDPNKTPLNTEEKENTKTTPSPSTSNTAVKNAPSKTIANTNPNGMVMIINVLCSCLQSVQGPELRLTTLQLLQHLSKYIYEQKQNQNDNQNQNNKNKNNQSQKNNTTAKKETKMNNSNNNNNNTTINKKRHNVRLQRILPHVLQCAKDQDSRVRGASVQVLTALVESIESHHLQPEDAHLFPDYIFPALKTIIIKEIDGTAKMIFVNCISRLATESQRYLEMSRTFKQNEAFDTTEKEEKKRNETTQKEENDVYTKSIRVAGSYDKQLTHLRDLVSKIIASLVANYRTHSNGSSIGYVSKIEKLKM